METIQLVGKFKIDKGLTVKDPLVTINSIFYNFKAMTAVVTVQMDNNQYSHERELDAEAFLKELTIEDIKAMISNQFTLKKQ